MRKPLIFGLLLGMMYSADAFSTYIPLEDCETENEMTGILLEGTEKPQDNSNGYE